MGKNYFTEQETERNIFDDWVKTPTRKTLEKEHELNKPHGSCMVGGSFKQAYEAYSEMKGGF